MSAAYDVPPVAPSAGASFAPPHDAPKVEWALWLAGRGLPVHPNHWPVATAETKDAAVCSCRAGAECDSVGKHPLHTGWQSTATTDAARLRTAWAKDPNANPGIATGAGGLIVLDGDGAEGRASLDALSAKHGPLPRTFTVATGGGVQFYFTKPAGIGKIKNTVAIATRLDIRADGGAGGGNAIAPGALHWSGRRYVVQDDAAVAEAPPWLVAFVSAKPEKPKARQASVPRPRVSSRGYGNAALESACTRIANAPDGTRNSVLNEEAFSIAQLVAGGEIAEVEARSAIESAARLSGLGDDEIAKTMRSAFDAGEKHPRTRPERVGQRVPRARSADGHANDAAMCDEERFADVDATDAEHWREAEADAPSGRVRVAEVPTIKLGVDVHRVVDEAIGALALDGETYARGGALARVVHAPANQEGRVRRREAATIIRPHTAASLFETLTRVASWQRFDGRAGQWMPATPGKQIVAALIDRAAWAGIPELVGLAATPLLRADGTVAQTPGFDADSGYLLTFGRDDFELVPDAPTKVDALAARDAVLEIVCDFPFSSQADRSAWLALLLSVFARPAILGPLPLFLVLSNVRGAGKSRLVDAVAILKTGRLAARATQPADEAEAGKLFTSILLEGDEIVLLDNIAHAIGGAKLDALLTGETWKDRLLGGNVTVNLPIRTTFTAGGNNLEIIGDTQRRVLPSTLESPLEKPEDRQDFKHADLLAWLRAERPRLVVAVLTILRAWFVAGRPQQEGVRPWGSYESFSAIVPQVICWLDLADPQRTRLEIEDHDPVKQALGALMSQWPELVKACGRIDGITIREALDKLYPAPPLKPDEALNDLRDALETLAPGTGTTRVNGRALGKAFQKAAKRTIGGHRLQRVAGDEHTHSNRWAVL